jgi:hypothetical protein
LKVYGLGFEISDLGLRVQAGFRVKGPGSGI